MIVGFSAGGGTDVVARILAQKMSESLGQTVVVENRSGASGLIAGEAVAKSAPDGYTLMMGTQTTFAVAPTLYRKVSLDPARDFAGIAMAAVSPLVLVVHPVGARAIGQGRDRDGQGEARHGQLRIGRARHDAAHDRRAVPSGRRHQDGARRLSRRGAGHQRSPGRADSPHVRELVRRRSATCGPDSCAALAVTGAQRAAAAPEIPTVAEAGLPGFEAATWFALVAPAGTPRDILARLNAEVKRALAQADVKQRYADLGMTAEDSTPDEPRRLHQVRDRQVDKVIKDADIKAPE